MARSGRVTKSRLEQRERMMQALELRKAGATYAQIAEACGYASEDSAYSAVKSMMAKVIKEPAEELLTLQYERLNHMLVVQWPQVQAGDQRAIDTCLRIMDKMDRLFGIDNTPTMNVTNYNEGNVVLIDGDTQTYIEGLRALIAQRNGNGDQPALPPARDDVIDVQPIEDTHTNGKNGARRNGRTKHPPAD